MKKLLYIIIAMLAIIIFLLGMLVTHIVKQPTLNDLEQCRTKEDPTQCARNVIYKMPLHRHR